MSEFSSGTLILRKNKDFFKDIDINDSIIKDISKSWTVLLIKDYYIESEIIPQYLLDISKGCPILQFENFEDGGWMYRILYDGRQVANLAISYEIADKFIFDLIEKSNPEIDDITEYVYFDEEGKREYSLIPENIRNNEDYLKSIEEQFINSNVKEFKLFDFPEKIIDSLS